MNRFHKNRILSLPLNSLYFSLIHIHPPTHSRTHTFSHLPPSLPPSLTHIHTCTLFSYRCVGTIKQYYAASNVHLVVFDEPYLQPQWVKAVTEDVDILLGSEETGGTGYKKISFLFCISFYI